MMYRDFILILIPAFVPYSIACCVTHFGVWNNVKLRAISEQNNSPLKAQSDSSVQRCDAPKESFGQENLNRITAGWRKNILLVHIFFKQMNYVDRNIYHMAG